MEKKYYHARGGYPYYLNDIVIDFNKEQYMKFLKESMDLAKNYQEAIKLCFYKQEDNKIKIYDMKDIEMTEFRRGDVLTYVSKNRDKLIKQASQKNLVADSILHSHPLTREEFKEYKKNKRVLNNIIENLAPISFGDFYKMGQWQDNFRGVVIATPEECFGPFIWFVDRKDMNISLVKEHNIIYSSQTI